MSKAIPQNMYNSIAHFFCCANCSALGGPDELSFGRSQVGEVTLWCTKCDCPVIQMPIATFASWWTEHQPHCSCEGCQN